VEHYRGLEQTEESDPLSRDDGPLKRFLIKSGGEVHFIPVEEVDWLEAVGYYTKIHFGQNSHLIRGNLGSIEARLDGKRFARIHRSALVNLRRIKMLRNYFRGDCAVVLLNGTELKVSRGYRQHLEMLL